MKQRHISNELTHFVGRHLLGNEDAQYDALVKILTSGLLKTGGLQAGEEPQEGMVSTRFALSRRLSDSEGLIQPRVVCFCDIPLPDVQLHMEKYGRFGIAFRKEFLIGKGAAPVFYVPRGVVLFQRTRVEHLDELGEELKKKWTRELKDPTKATRHEMTIAERFLEDIVLTYLKTFDETKPEDAPHNYYMEREWRTRTSIRFTLDDVHRLILPAAYKTRLRQNVPGYMGQTTFV